ncbi:uncharacterized protein LOC133799500 [Humulus lupulus]|uniref:uncharacterized protein LOC133799500 n=1 Tax=Humulus lupulus TaxID=3486 RepID=UPI002B40A8DC|nr:uncharacterized protein LOC133799500 [Humulus lupulus]
MDKEWMSADRMSVEYIKGVDEFLKFSLDHAKDPNYICCPCSKCGNMKKMTATIIKEHLYFHGIDKSYKIWYWHYEELHVTPNPPMMNEDRNYRQLDPEDNLDEMIDDAYYESEVDPIKFENLLNDAEKPIYSGCTKFSKLSALLRLYNIKAKNGWSDKSFTELLVFLKNLRPEENEMPVSFYEAKKTMCSIGLQYEKIHACPNDCVLYRNSLVDANSCPTCGVSRWQKKRNLEEVKEGVPAKVLWYIPPIPRLTRFYRNVDHAKNLTWHANERIKDGRLRHPADSPAWKTVDFEWPSFANEPRNIRLALSTDGINPHTSLSSKYSCWPIMLVIYNLPPWLCMKRKFTLLTLLISGPKQPGNDIDVYLAPLIDDLKTLWNEGVRAYDAYRKEEFTLRVVLLWTINDFPAYGNLSVPLTGNQVLNKVSVIQFKVGKPIVCPIKKKKGRGKSVGKDKIEVSLTSADESTSPWKKKSILFELEYWEKLLLRHNLDVMHIEKNVCDSLIGTLLNIPSKSKDGIKARKDLAALGLRKNLHPKADPNRTFLPVACYTLTKDEKKELCNCLYNIKVPEGYSSNIRTLVDMKNLNLVGMKSHDCHVLFQHILPVAIREEAIEFCSEYLHGVTSVGDQSTLNKSNGGYGGKGGVICSITQDERHEAHCLVLQNIDEIQPYIE